MSRRSRRADRRATRAVRAVRAVVTLVVLGLVAACSFSSGGLDPDVVPTPAQVTSAPPAGVRDPATDPRFARFYQQKLSWHGCGGGFKCSTLTVPVDWADPAGATLAVAVNRLPAGGKKIGSLVINPGGPGASGLQYARAAQSAFGSAILNAYDIVGFDPRGVGESDPVKCLPNSELDKFVASDQTPDDPQELASAVADVKSFGEACLANSGPLIRHVDTLSVVKDLDVLRAALGESVLTYHGASYGTYIGAWYAQTFPWRVGRMTLDGAIDPSLTSAQYLAGQAEGFSRALNAFVKNCEAQPDCPLHGSVQDGLNQLGVLVNAADSAPLSTDSGRQLTQSLMLTGIDQGLYDVRLWPRLTVGLADALGGDGSGLMVLADAYLERNAKGEYGQILSANPAIFCLDVAETRSPEQLEAAADALDREYPPLGGSIGFGSVVCADWPLPAVMPRQRLTARGAAPILVIGTVDDPATPYEWAQSLASQLSSGRLLTWEGTEHTAYHQGSSCIDDAVEKYLLTGVEPAVGTRCT